MVGVRGEIVIPVNRFASGWSRADARNRVAHLTTCLDSRRLALEGAAFVAYDVVGDADSISSEFRTPNAEEFPCDGIVFKVVSRLNRAHLGATRRAPRWALAYKWSVDELRGLGDLEGIPLPNVRL